MLTSRIFSSARPHNTLLFRRVFKFSSENKPSQNNKGPTAREIIEPAKNDSKLTEKRIYSYDPVRFQQVNDKAFVLKIQEIEKMKKLGPKKADGYKFPIFLALTAAFLYHCWLTVPYNVVYKHATINEYINQRNYFHAIFLSPLSYQNFGQFIVYFPLMLYALLLLGPHIKQKHMALLYLTNSLVTFATTYYVEKHYKGVNLMKPRPTGGVTPLCFISTFLMIQPSHLIFKSRMLPFFVVPLIYYIYEINEYRQNDSKEISSEAHFASISYGLLCGLIFRMLITKGKI